jgi:23S rRNA (guanine745-N1)-methyltransferase
VAARRSIHDLGLTRPLLEAFREVLQPTPNDILLDAGCGEGFYVASLGSLSGARCHGIDISVPAIEAAARRYPEYTWIVANADRFLPYADRTFSAVLSITGRMNRGEFRRVLRPDGRLLVAVPAPDDLIELRGPGRDRSRRIVEEVLPDFNLENRSRATAAAELPADIVAQLLRSVYRPRYSGPLPSTVTFSLDVLLFTSAATEPDPNASNRT